MSSHLNPLHTSTTTTATPVAKQLEKTERDIVPKCPICLGDNTSKISFTNCDCYDQCHQFCLQEWVKIRSQCPTCNKIVNPILITEQSQPESQLEIQDENLAENRAQIMEQIENDTLPYYNRPINTRINILEKIRDYCFLFRQRNKMILYLAYLIIYYIGMICVIMLIG